MTPQDLIASLQSIDFFENYPHGAIEKAKEHILKDKLYKERKRQDPDDCESIWPLIGHWPGIRLAPDILVADDDRGLGQILKQIAKQSFGILEPANIKAKSLDSGLTKYLRFEQDGRIFQDEFYMPGRYLPNEYFQMISEVAEYRHGLKLHLLDHLDTPDDRSWGGALTWVFATDRAMQAASDAGILPQATDINTGMTGSSEQLLADMHYAGDTIHYKWIPHSEPHPEHQYLAGTVIGVACGYSPKIHFARAILCSPASHARRIEAWEFVTGNDRVYGLELPLYSHWHAHADDLEAAMTLKPFKRMVIDEARFDQYASLRSLTVKSHRKFKSVEPKLFKDPEYAHGRYAAKAAGMLADTAPYLAWSTKEEASQAMPVFNPSPWPNRSKSEP